MPTPSDPPRFIGPNAPNMHVWHDKYGRIGIASGYIVQMDLSPPVIAECEASWAGWNISDDGIAWASIDVIGGLVTEIATGVNETIPSSEAITGGTRYYVPLAKISGRRIFPILSGSSAISFSVPTGTTDIP